MTVGLLADIVDKMKPGVSVVYHRGHLALQAEKSTELRALRDLAQRLSNMRIASPTGSLHLGMGMVTLSQRRVGNDYEYIATRLHGFDRGLA